MKTRRQGFTLVEMIVVISIIGIIAAAVAVFLRLPLQSYQDAQRRAAISDAADTVFIRLKRDLQTALPNSVRVTSVGAVVYLEFLAVRTGGRYRAEVPQVPVASNPPVTCPDTDGDTFANENVLQFGVADTCFTTLGALPDFATIAAGAAGDYVVAYNLGPGFLDANAYETGAATGGNKSRITAVNAGVSGENVIQFELNIFKLESPGRRFQIVSGPVSYVCDPGAGTLRRVTGYAITAVQPAPAGGDLLAQGITACSMTYNVVNQRNSVVAIALGFSDPVSATKVSLFQEVQLGNVP